MKNVKKSLATILCITMAGACLTGCGEVKNTSGLDPEAVLLTVGDEDVSLQEGYFMIKWQQSEYQAMASNFYGEEWYNQDLEGNGQTMLDYLKDNTMQTLEDMYVCVQQAEKLGVSLTDEEKKKVEETTKAFLNANSSETLAAMMADEETVRTVLTNYALYYKVYNEVVKDADTSVPAEEAKQMVYSYVYQPLTTTDSEGNQTDYTDSEKQKIYNDLLGIAEAVKGGKEFDEACEDAGYNASSHQFSADGSDNDSFADINGEAAKLKVGGVSDLIPVEGGVFLLHLDSDNDEEKTEEARKTKAEEKQIAAFEEWLENTKKDMEIKTDEDLWGKVSFEQALQAVAETEAP